MTDNEREALIALATCQGVTLSEYIRGLLQTHVHGHLAMPAIGEE